MVAAEDLTPDDVEDAADQRQPPPSDDQPSKVVGFKGRVREEEKEDDEDSEDGDAPKKKRLNLAPVIAKLSALATRVRSALRPLAIAGGVALILAWTAMLWQINGSIESIGESASVIAAAGGVPPAAEATSEAEQALAVAPEPPEAAVEPPRRPIDVAWTEPPPVKLTPGPPRTLFGLPVRTEGQDLWDCTDFETWEQAKLVYDANRPQDPNILDFFLTGVPCQSLYLETPR